MQLSVQRQIICLSADQTVQIAGVASPTYFSYHCSLSRACILLKPRQNLVRDRARSHITAEFNRTQRVFSKTCLYRTIE